jgi:hypothetical protein
VRIDHGDFAPGERVALSYDGTEHQVQICGVDVAISHDGALGEGAEGGDDAGFARSAFAADDH